MKWYIDLIGHVQVRLCDYFTSRVANLSYWLKNSNNWFIIWFSDKLIETYQTVLSSKFEAIAEQTQRETQYFISSGAPDYFL